MSTILEKNTKYSCPRNIELDKDLSQVLYSKTGGKAQYYLSPKSLNDLYTAIKFCSDKTVNLTYIGQGSNILVSDKGVDGLVVQTINAKGFHFCGGIFSVISGVSVKDAVTASIEKGFTGLEPLLGLNGTVGGCITNNANNFDTAICDHLLYVDAIDKHRNIVRISKGELNPKFRTTKVKDLEICILEASFALQPSNNSSTCFVNANNMLKINAISKKPCVGPIFKNKDIEKLIIENKLEGIKGNNCHFSKNKKNYIINDGGATSSDIYKLFQEIKNKIEKDSKVKLINNINLIGEF